MSRDDRLTQFLIPCSRDATGDQKLRNLYGKPLRHVYSLMDLNVSLIHDAESVISRIHVRILRDLLYAAAGMDKHSAD
jgi:hypothetical protein